MHKVKISDTDNRQRNTERLYLSTLPRRKREIHNTQKREWANIYSEITSTQVRMNGAKVAGPD